MSFQILRTAFLFKAHGFLVCSDLFINIFRIFLMPTQSAVVLAYESEIISSCIILLSLPRTGSRVSNIFGYIWANVQSVTPLTCLRHDQ